MREGYMTAAQAAEAYGYGKMYLYRRRDMGLLTAYKFIGDKHTYWKTSELEALSHRDDEQPTEKWRREVLD